MKNFQNRAAYFELENALETTTEFSDKVKTVRLISNWASEQLGYDNCEAEAYARVHIANIVRENEVAKMLRRIETDLFNNNIDIDSALMVKKSQDILKNALDTLRDAKD